MVSKKNHFQGSQKQKIEESNINNIYKAIPPVSQPNSRSKRGNIAIPSDSNADLSKEWVDFHKL